MNRACNRNLARQLVVLQNMFENLDIKKESDFVDSARRRLESENILIHKCPHWCERVEVLCKCILDADPAPDCIVAGVVPGNFQINENVELVQQDMTKIA